MQRRVFVIIIVVLIVLVLGVAGFLFAQQQGFLDGSNQPQPVVPSIQDETPPTPVLVKVIVAKQPFNKGSEIIGDILTVKEVPESSVPEDRIFDEIEAIGKLLTADISQGQIIVKDLLRDKTAQITESEASLGIPAGHVMVAFPINRYSSVAYALQPGDWVDVLMSVSIVDFDIEFQTILPNQFSLITRQQADDDSVSVSIDPPIQQGRFITALGDLPGIEYPTEEQRPRRVAQLTVQRAKVIRVGPWVAELAAPPSTEEGTPTPTPPLPDIVSLAVTPQDALVLLWARQTQAYMELALRAAGEQEAKAEHSTEAVTLQYMLTRFNIAVPPKLEFAIDKSDVFIPTPGGGGFEEP